jgi:hypothetical protein
VSTGPRPACICEFPPDCGGLGVLVCEGCGGDFCVCGACLGHGEIECEGCEYCTGDDEDPCTGAGQSATQPSWRIALNRPKEPRKP